MWTFTRPSSFTWDGTQEGVRTRLGGYPMGREPPSPRPGCLQSRLLDSGVSQVFAHMIQTSHPSSNHAGYSSRLSSGKNKGEIRAHIPRIENIFCCKRKAKYFPANVRRETASNADKKNPETCPPAARLPNTVFSWFLRPKSREAGILTFTLYMKTRKEGNFLKAFSLNRT